MIIVTGYGRELTGDRLHEISRCAILQKPFGGEELGRALRSVLETAAAGR